MHYASESTSNLLSLLFCTVFVHFDKCDCLGTSFEVHFCLKFTLYSATHLKAVLNAYAVGSCPSTTTPINQLMLDIMVPAHAGSKAQHFGT